MLALRMGKKGMMEKLFAAGAKVEATDEVHGRRGWWAGDVWWAVVRGTASARCRTCSERCVDVVVHAIQNAQDGMTALELAPDEGTVKCFLDYGIKLADIVTDEVVIACVSVSDGPASYVCDMSVRAGTDF